MIISRKRFERELEEAKREVMTNMERDRREADWERWTDQRFMDSSRCMNDRYDELDRRLRELERRASMMTGTAASARPTRR